MPWLSCYGLGDLSGSWGGAAVDLCSTACGRVDGRRVLANGNLIKEGLDLIELPTLIETGIEYRVNDLRQRDRRAQDAAAGRHGGFLGDRRSLVGGGFRSDGGGARGCDAGGDRLRGRAAVPRGRTVRDPRAASSRARGARSDASPRDGGGSTAAQAHGDFHAAVDLWRGAWSLYRGPFLDGFFLGDAPEFERWMDLLEDAELVRKLIRGEILEDAAGRTWTYDVNTNTNYNSDAEKRAGGGVA